jgi:glycosyltransferase involved in cell wall biosynthesis
MIPEILGADMNHPMWAEKVRAINEASAYVCVSQNTANDLLKFHPDLSKEKIIVAHNGVGFQQPSAAQVAAFKGAHQIHKPYFLISGGRSSYKNTIQFFNAFAQLGDERAAYSIVCTGPREPLPAEMMALVGNATVHLVDLTDEELTCAYAGAVALVYPSLYEGFGMPIIEAMACGCPVITCPCGPLPEVGGDAVIYVAPHDVGATLAALRKVQEEETRTALIAKGLERARLFSWKAMADRMAAVLSSFLQPA